MTFGFTSMMKNSDLVLFPFFLHLYGNYFTGGGLFLIKNPYSMGGKKSETTAKHKCKQVCGKYLMFNWWMELLATVSLRSSSNTISQINSCFQKFKLGWWYFLETCLNSPHDSLEEQKPVCEELQHNCEAWMFTSLPVFLPWTVLNNPKVVSFWRCLIFVITKLLWHWDHQYITIYYRNVKGIILK